LPGCVLALYTAGLIESPGVDIDETLPALGRRLAETGDRGPAAGRTGGRAGRVRRRGDGPVDDIALLLLRARVEK
jgi:hypothetical protein